jgi:outer membrane protein assembly factor BamB
MRSQSRNLPRGGTARLLPGLTRLVLGGALMGALAEDWPQWLGPQRDSVWRESGILQTFPPGGPPVRWRVALGGGFAGPAVAGPQVFVMDRQMTRDAAPPPGAAERHAIPGKERVLCFDDTDGRLLWQHEYACRYSISYPAGPRATPLVADGKVFTLGAEGHLFCLSAASGKVVWSHDFKTEYGAKTPEWGFAGHPLLDGERLLCIVGASNALAVAFDRDTGRELWRALGGRNAGYAPPTVIAQAGRRTLVVWEPDSVNGLAPETGRVLWRLPFRVRTDLTVATPRQSGDYLYLSSFYDGSRLFRLGASEPALVWASPKASERDTTDLHALICTPFIDHAHIYGVCSYGQLRCLQLATGKRLWETLAATTPEQPTRWGNAFLVKHADRFFLFNERGDLIIARLTPQGYQELSRAHLLDPTNPEPGRPVVWSHPAFARRACYVRNDRELISVSLAETAAPATAAPNRGAAPP